MLDLLRAHISTSKRYSINVWDISIRLFHWALVVGIAFQWYSSEEGGNIMTWHIYIGYCMLGLVLYRIIWGVIGSPYARFSSFLKGPSSTLIYLKGFVQGKKYDYPGHNPLGGWMVMLLLLLILIQGITGLFSSDDIFTEGPFYSLVSGKTADFLTSIHHLNFNILLGAIALHISAVAYHGLIKKEPLVKSMLTGKKIMHQPSSLNTRPNYIRMFITTCIAAAGVYLLIYLT